MSGRSGLISSGGGGSGGAGDPSNQPMDLAQKTAARSLESGGIVKSGGTTLVHYTTGVPQILTTSGTTAHVVTAKPIGRTESMGVGGQTMTLVSRSSAPPSALNLASQGSGGSSGGPVRTVSHAPGGTNTNTVVTSASTAHLGFHIPRGAAAVANIAAPRSQTVATPIVRTTALPGGQPGSNVPGPRGSVVGQRVVPVSTNGGWIRSTPSPAHTGKVTGPSMLPGVTATSLSLGVQRASMPMPRLGPGGGAITTYHTGVRPGNVSSGSIRGPGTTTMRGMVTGDGTKSTGPKTVHITQPIGPGQKYGNMSAVSGRGVVASGPNPGGSSSGTIYNPGNPMVTTMSGPGVNPQTTIRTQAPPAIAVRITTAPVSTATSSSQVTSQAGTSIGAIAMTSPSGSSPGAILTHQSPMHRSQQDQVPLKTPIVRTPVASHQNKGGVQAQTLAFSDGPKVITQPAQGPPLALAQISGLAGVTTQKAQVNSVSQQHTTSVQHRPGGAVMGSGVGRVMSGSGIPVAKVLPQQAAAPPQGSVSVTGTPRASHGQVRAQSPGQAADPQAPHTNVYLQRAHTGVTVTSGTPAGQGERVVTTVPQYNIAPPYYYEQGQNTYQVGGPALVPHTLGSTHYVPTNMQSGSLRVTAGGATPGVGAGSGHGGPGQLSEGPSSQSSVPVPSMKPGASPRPSILRKRPDSDGTPLKAAKNLTAALCLPMPSPPSPKRPDSRGNGNASSGSTTISANSSPDSSLSGLQIEELDGSSNTAPGNNAELRTPPSIKQEPPDDATVVLPRQPVMCSMTEASPNMSSGIVTTTLNVPQPHLSVTGIHGASQGLTDGLSPRKKPRKQQLTGNELQEARSSEDDLDHPPMKKTKRDITEDNHDLEGSEDEGGGWSEPGGGSSGGSYGSGGGGTGPNASNAVNASVVITNRPTMSLLSSFRQTWKPRHNHFVRHTDVKPKDERRLTVNEIANQKMALQRVNGWKVVHLSGQVDDLVELESDVVDRLHLLLTSLEKRTHGRKPYKDFDKDINRLSELVKANIQRSKIIKDQMTEAKSQMEKLFEHKGKIVEIMTKYSSKRSVRKKEKS